MSCGSDDGDDVGTLTCAGLCLDDVFVDVTCSDDDIEIRFRSFAYGVKILFTASAASAYLVDVLVDDWLQGVGDLLAVSCHDLGQVQFAFCHELCYLLRFLACCYHCVGDEEEHAFAEYASVFQSIDDDIWQRHLIIVDAVDADETTQSTFYGDGCILFHKTLYIVGDVFRQLTSLSYFFKI